MSTNYKEKVRPLKGTWPRLDQTPFSRSFVYELIRLGIVKSVLVQIPGHKRGVRLVDGDSLDRFLRSETTKQQRNPKKSGVKYSK
jgi:hypothetical protein